VDLELSDEQVWLEESINTLLDREWPAPDAAWRAGEAERSHLWSRLVDFGLVGGESDLGAIELCLAARAGGGHLASGPFLGTAAVRYALAPFASELPSDFQAVLDGGDRVAIAQLEPGAGWSWADPRAATSAHQLTGVKAAVEHAAEVDRLVVTARVNGEAGLVLAGARADRVEVAPQATLDATVPLSRVQFDHVALEAAIDGQLAATIAERLTAVGGLLAAAEAVGAAAGLFALARQYASERRQFGRSIGSNQALRHLMADLHVRQASSWSTTLYAAAALDDGIPGAQETASVAKAYVARAAREVAHGSMQVFGGIAFTEEHPAHRFLRRIVVREQQFGDAAHHERELGKTLAARAGHHARDAAPDPVINVA
jgi:alkylation response protein AidB-like acyl-CoA dehydrogenase